MCGKVSASGRLFIAFLLLLISLVTLLAAGCLGETDPVNRMRDRERADDTDGAGGPETQDSDDTGPEDGPGFGSSGSVSSRPLEDRLFIMGFDPFTSRLVSYLQTDFGWREYDIPQDSTIVNPHLGPTFFLEGRIGFGALNYRLDHSAVFRADMTLRHEWLRWDAENGWTADAVLQEIGALRNIRKLFATSEDTFWVSAAFRLDAYSPEYPAQEVHIQQDSLFFVDGENSSRLLGYSGYDISSISFADESFGYISTRPLAGQHAFLLRYEGGTWAMEYMPTECWRGDFEWVRIVDHGLGYAVGICGKKNLLFSWDGGAWSPVTVPSHCSLLDPVKVYASEDLALVIAHMGDHIGGYWVYRDGEWECRAMKGQTVNHALVMKNGRVFIAGVKEENPGMPVVYEVTGSGVTPVVLPPGPMTITGLHAVGPNAPAYNPAE
jgi:hypothetical protein